MLKTLRSTALTVLLAACATPQPRPSQTAPSAAPESMPAAGDYRIDPQRSELRVLVYRGGPLANFGHNHVLVNRALSGTVHAGASLETSTFTLSIPVTQFSVDEPQARREEGEEFPGEVSESAREGTLHNMLAAPLLNADSFPNIEIRGEQLQATQGSLNATMALRIAGYETHIAAPFRFASAADGLTASASFELRQTELGLTPSSLLAGALQVRDAIHIKLTLTAIAGPPAQR